MKKKILIGLGSIIFIYFFFSVIFPKHIGVPLAKYISKETLTDYKHNRQKQTDFITKFPKQIGFVNDFEQIFTDEQRQSLELKLKEYEKNTTREFVIITIDSITPYTSIQKFASDLSNEWGVGKKETNNGLSIVFSKNLRKIRISTGKGTEKILTDEVCKNIIDQTIIPELKNGNYYSGIEKGITEIIAKWK